MIFEYNPKRSSNGIEVNKTMVTEKNVNWGYTETTLPFGKGFHIFTTEIKETPNCGTLHIGFSTGENSLDFYR